MKDAATRIREFVLGHLDGVLVDDDEDLFDGGHVNSLFIVQLVMWLERTLGVVVEGTDLDLDNFRTIETIADFAARKSSRTSGAV
ncbi:acyl carrier protein [Actinosynnema sp. NPDC023794]